jgi:P27 family predicted phage terminase small subunit
MARPCKSVLTMSKNLTNDEKNNRIANEEKLKGDSKNISPPEYLSSKQKEIFKYIVNELTTSGILGNLDIYILATCAIAIDRLEVIEGMINEKFSRVMNKDLMAAKDKYNKDLFRTVNELSLSPQSRAKLGNINFKAEQDKIDPVLNAIRGND